MKLAVSTKLTSIVLVSSFLIILLAFTPIIYVYRADLNLPTILGLITAIGTAVGSTLLVWKWLKDSLYKKMEHVHEDYLLDLYKNLKSYDDDYINQFFQPSIDIRKLRTDLGKYASFLTIKLYPAKLLQKMDTFLATLNVLDKKVQQLVEIGNKKLGQCNKWNLLAHLGIGVRPIPLSEEQGFEYMRVIPAIQSEHQNLIDEIKRILDTLKKLKNSILEEFEEFLKRNNLKTE